MRHLCLLLPLLCSIYACESLDTIGALVPPTVDQDRSLPSVAVNVAGRQRLIHVRTFGNPSNPPLFILHGSFTDTRPYRNICESLADKYHVVIWDQRGCGLSERITEEEFTLETAVEEINAMKNIYAPNQKVTLIGQSWGGGLATLYTSKHPEKVAQLLLIEPMPLTAQDMQQLFSTIVQFGYDNGSWNNFARHGQALSPRDHEQLDYRAMMILRSTMTASYHCDGNNPPEWPIHRVGGFLEYVRNQRLGNPLSGFTYKTWNFSRTADVNGQYFHTGLKIDVLPGYYGTNWAFAPHLSLSYQPFIHIEHSEYAKQAFQNLYPSGSGSFTAPKNGWFYQTHLMIQTGVSVAYFQSTWSLNLTAGFQHQPNRFGLLLFPDLGMLPFYGGLNFGYSIVAP